MEQHMKLLGHRVKDTVTGFAGVVSSIGFDLYGCIQAVVTPPANDKGELGDGRWFDVSRLEVVSDQPVMAVPNFGALPTPKAAHGPAEKPIR